MARSQPKEQENEEIEPKVQSAAELNWWKYSNPMVFSDKKWSIMMKRVFIFFKLLPSAMERLSKNYPTLIFRWVGKFTNLKRFSKLFAKLKGCAGKP